MGIVYNKFELSKDLINKSDAPIISCLLQEITHEMFSDYTHINLGIELSKRLIKVDIEKRASIVESELNKILKQNDIQKLLITNIDILFNPSYQLDVLNYFIKLSRLKTIAVQWCGEFKQNGLIYSKREYSDYKKYEINKYNIICLK